MVTVSDEWQVLDVVELHKVKDPHSLLQYQDDFLIVSTGNDRIIKVDEAGNETIYRTFSKKADGSLHVNSLAMLPKGLAISAFGERHGLLKKSAIHGIYMHVSPFLFL